MPWHIPLCPRAEAQMLTLAYTRCPSVLTSIQQSHRTKTKCTKMQHRNESCINMRGDKCCKKTHQGPSYRHASLDSKAQGHRGSCTNAKSNSMCNGGIAQGEQYGGGQTAEQPRSNAPMRDAARSTMHSVLSQKIEWISVD